MSKYNYDGPEKFKPISAWGYVGYSILFCIPIIGWIIWIVFAFSGKNINRRSFARSYFCHFLLLLIVFVVLVVLMHFNIGGLRKDFEKWNIPYLNDAVKQTDTWLPANDSASSKTTTEKNTEKPAAQATAKNTEKPTAQATAKKETSTVTAAPKSETAKSSGSQNTGNAAGVRKEIKDAIDGYEAFFKEYTDFMKKYAKSSNQLSMLTDYTKMLARYAETMEKWEKFDKEHTMNDAEAKYFMDATLRIDKMLLEVAY